MGLGQGLHDGLRTNSSKGEEEEEMGGGTEAEKGSREKRTREETSTKRYVL